MVVPSWHCSTSSNQWHVLDQACLARASVSRKKSPFSINFAGGGKPSEQDCGVMEHTASHMASPHVAPRGRLKQYYLNAMQAYIQGLL